MLTRNRRVKPTRARLGQTAKSSKGRMPHLPPPSISHPLIVYLADDQSIWAVNAADGNGYQIQLPVGTPASGVPEAPTDGQTYGRQDAGWTATPPIPATSLLITSILPVSALESTTPEITVNGSGFTATSVITWGGYALATTFVSSTSLTASLNLGPGSAGIYTVWVTDGEQKSNSVAFTVIAATQTTFTLGASGPTCALDINADGDLIITQSVGPNAGKSVNLTYAKWT
jgi:hypothetical protein